MSNVISTNTDMSTQPSNQRWIVVALSVTGVIIVLAVIIFAMPTSIFPLTGVAPAPTLVKDWQTYNDPSGHFTMRMPADWQEIETDHGSIGFAGTSFQITTYWFGPHDQIQNTPPPISFAMRHWCVNIATHEIMLTSNHQRYDDKKAVMAL